MSETKTVEDLDAQIAELRAQKRAQRELDRQRKVLLPQLHRKHDRLLALANRTNVELDEVQAAITDVDEGRLTDYLVRKPPVRKPKAEAADNSTSTLSSVNSAGTSATLLGSRIAGAAGKAE